MDLTRRQAVGGLLATAAALPAMTGRAIADEAITIGYTGPLSGGAALYGRNCLDGIEMAANEINKAGGVDVGGKKYTISVVGLDDKYSPAEAAVNAKRLKAQYKAPFIFVPHSGGIYALQAINEQENFIVGAYSSAPAITEKNNKLTVRIPPSFADYFNPFTKVAMSKSGKKLAMAGGDHEYGKAWAALIGPFWEKAGGTIVANNPMSYNKDTDFYSGVSKVIAAKPDVLFIGGASEPTALVVKQARELEFEGEFMIMDQAKLDEMALVLGGYAMLEGAVAAMPIASDPRGGLEDYVQRVNALYKRPATSEIAFNYSTMNAVAEAMTLAGSATDPQAIMAKIGDAFAKLPAARNPAHSTGMDAKGALGIPAVSAFVKDGKIIPVDPAGNMITN